MYNVDFIVYFKSCCHGNKPMNVKTFFVKKRYLFMKICKLHVTNIF